MSKDSADSVRKLCLAIRTRTDNYSVDIRHWLRDLHELKEAGWSPDALPVLQLIADCDTLRILSSQLYEMAGKLTQPEKPNESA